MHYTGEPATLPYRNVQSALRGAKSERSAGEVCDLDLTKVIADDNWDTQCTTNAAKQALQHGFDVVAQLPNLFSSIVGCIAPDGPYGTVISTLITLNDDPAARVKDKVQEKSLEVALDEAAEGMFVPRAGGTGRSKYAQLERAAGDLTHLAKTTKHITELINKITSRSGSHELVNAIKGAMAINDEVDR